MQSSTETFDAPHPAAPSVSIPVALRTYAVGLLAGSDSTLDDVARIAAGTDEVEPDDALASVAEALRAGWSAADRLNDATGDATLPLPLNTTEAQR